jgi:hypothetical protein
MRSIAALFAASFLFAGCAAQPADTSDDGQTESADDAIATSTLYGTWEGEGGKIYKITFEKTSSSTLGGMKGRAFTATIDTGIRCITTPCPSSTDVAGVYKLSHGTKLTLSAYDKPTKEFAAILGDYSVKVKAGNLTLTKSDGTKETFHPAKVTGVACGDTTCGEGQYCCDPLHSRCIKMGFMCAL